MEVLLGFVLVIGLATYLVVVSSSFERRRSRRRHIDSIRVRCLNGAGEAVECEDVTVVPFELAGRKARLRVPESGGRTGVEVGGPELTKAGLHVFQSGGHGVRSDREDRTIGDPVFDAAWVVQGDLAARLFAPESRAEVVASIHALRRYFDPCVEVSGGFLRVSVRQAPESELMVRALVAAAKTVLESLGPRVADGMIWVEVRHDAAAVCQVCGMEEGGGKVVCRSCRTPHHADCWRYVGRCSTYGCGSQDALRAR